MSLSVEMQQIRRQRSKQVREIVRAQMETARRPWLTRQARQVGQVRPIRNRTAENQQESTSDLVMGSS